MHMTSGWHLVTVLWITGAAGIAGLLLLAIMHWAGTKSNEDEKNT
jgi:uncharacterized protein involved in response to NO